MKSHLTVFALTAILIVSIGMAPAFGQLTNDSIVVTTNQTSYTEGEIIVITGEVKDLYSGMQVTIMIKAPNGNLVRIAQEEIGADKKFSMEHTSGGPLMKFEGSYTILVTYGNENRTAETSFNLVVGEIPPSDNDIPTGAVSATEVSMGDGNDSIGYEITGGQLLSITPDVDANSLIVGIDATSDGSLTLTIPRSVEQSLLESGEDDEYIVLVDGEEVDFSEVISSTDRTLTIAFQEGSEEIEIIGTWVIPEFGTIAAMILAVAIVSIIAVSAKSRLSIMPRY